MSETVEARHDLAHVPLADPAGTSGLLAVFERRYLLRLMVAREIQARYAGSMFGLAWSYINPFTRFLTFYFVFGLLMGRGASVQNFAIHLFCGMVFVHYFTESVNSGTKSILSNRSVVQKMSMPRELFPLASMLVSLWHTLPQMLILALACLATGYSAGFLWHPDALGVLCGVLALLITMAFGTAMGLMFSCINVMFRDFQRILQTFMNMISFMVPMMYPYWIIPQKFGNGWIHQLYMANPGVWVVLLSQRAFWWPTCAPKCSIAVGPGPAPASFPPGLLLHGFLFLGLGLVLLVIAQRVFTRLEKHVPELL